MTNNILINKIFNRINAILKFLIWNVFIILLNFIMGFIIYY